MTDAWAAVHRELDGRLGRLEPDEALVLGEPVPAPESSPGRGLLARFRRRRRSPIRYVQFLHQGDSYLAECVGPSHWDSTPEQRRALLDAGWRESGASGNFAQTVLVRERARAIADGVGALEILGCDPGTDWVWEVIRY